MPSPESSILILPGISNSGPDHWQSHWERQDPSLERVVQREWEAPVCAEWVSRLDAVLAARTTPAVLVAHSSACALVAHWEATCPSSRLVLVKAAMLVGPSDPTGPNYPVGPTGFAPVPLRPLPFPTLVVASTNDPFVTVPQAQAYAQAWGSRFVLLENAGHINTASGHGPWPEGFAMLESLRR